MKKIKQLVLPGLVIAFILSSCSVEKGVYLSGYHFNWRNKNNSKEQVVDNTKKSEDKKNESTATTAQTSELASTENAVANEKALTASTENSIYVPATPKIDWNKKNTTVSSTEIKKILKTQKKKFSKSTAKPNSSGKRFHWAAITGFVTGLVGLLVAGIVLGICAIVFSTIAIVKIVKNSEEYRGLGMAIAGLILGLLDIILVAVLLAILL